MRNGAYGRQKEIEGGNESGIEGGREKRKKGIQRSKKLNSDDNSEHLAFTKC